MERVPNHEREETINTVEHLHTTDLNIEDILPQKSNKKQKLDHILSTCIKEDAMVALPYKLVSKEPLRAGLVVLQSDETIEADMRRLLPDSMELLVTRVPSAATVSSDTLQEMATVLTGAAALFPTGAPLSVVGYGCTSGSAQIGPAHIAALVKAGAMTANVTEPVSALIAACRALGVQRIGLISPYVAEVSARLIAVLAAQGIVVSAFESFDAPLEKNVVRISPDSIIDAAVAMHQAHQDVEAIFLSCTNLRTLDVIGPLEQDLGVPVMSSNQVLAWHMLQLAGGAGSPGCAVGQLWDQPLCVISDLYLI